MPPTIEELEAAIQDTELEANSMLFLNQNVLQEYQNRQREVSNYTWFIHAGQLAMIMFYCLYSCRKNCLLKTLRLVFMGLSTCVFEIFLATITL